MLNKFQNSKLLKRAVCFACVMLMACLFCFSCFAADPVSNPTPQEAASQVFSQITSTGGLNFTTILSVLGVVILAALSMVLGWWAVRKVIRSIMTAFKKGSLSV